MAVSYSVDDKQKKNDTTDFFEVIGNMIGNMMQLEISACCTRVGQKVLSLIGFLSFIPSIF